MDESYDPQFAKNTCFDPDEFEPPARRPAAIETANNPALGCAWFIATGLHVDQPNRSRFVRGFLAGNYFDGFWIVDELEQGAFA